MSFNSSTILGRLVRDPEYKMTTSGQAVCKITVATEQVWKNKAGEKQKQTDFHTVECWGQQADTINNYFKKGQEIMVEGVLSYDKWEKDGQKHTTAKIKMNRFSFAGKNEGGGQPNQQDTNQGSQETRDAFSPDDDIPF